MNEQDRARFVTKLQALRTEIQTTGPAKIEPNRTDAASVGVADEDAQALSEMLQTLASQQNRKQAEVLKQIDRALQKLDQDPADYGLCEDCGDDIPAKRLAFMPYATLCIDCQSSKDPQRGQSRKHTTDYR